MTSPATAPLAGVLLDLVLPRSCAGCETPGCRLCVTCADVLAAPPMGRLPVGKQLPVTVAAAEYSGVVRAVLLAHKERSARSLCRPLGAALAAAAAELAPPAGTVVVPIPSSRAAIRARGHDHARRLATTAARQLGLPCHPLLRQVRPVADQTGLGARGRAANLAGALAVRRRVQGLRVLVVDDVLTTGATMGEAVRALQQGGALVHGAAVVARTPGPRSAVPHHAEGPAVAPDGAGQGDRGGLASGPGAAPDRT